MSLIKILSVLALAVLLSAPAAMAGPDGQAAPSLNTVLETLAPQQVYCCVTCRKGKPCGDSCISRDKTCHQPPGCACVGPDGGRSEIDVRIRR